MLAKVRYDNRTTSMTQDEQKYWMHFLQGDPLVGDYIRSQMRHDPNYRRQVMNQPVCPSCEKFMFYDKDGTATCMTHGTVAIDKTHKVKIHLAEGHFR
jgi:hypothetical protein